MGSNLELVPNLEFVTILSKLQVKPKNLELAHDMSILLFLELINFVNKMILEKSKFFLATKNTPKGPKIWGKVLRDILERE